MATLPFDVISDIFLRLPLKPLIRLKLVCKVWRDLIMSDSFLQLYLIKSHEPSSPIYTQSIVVGGYRYLYFVEDIDCPFNRKPTKLTWHSCMLYGNVHLVGSCNGLVCFCSSPYLKHFVICNPWTKQMTEISCPIDNLGYKQPQNVLSLGFGYDSHNDDYKIIVIENGDDFVSPMLLYSLKAKSWKGLLHPVQNRYEICLPHWSSGCFVNDRLHWIVGVRGSKERCIVRFNLCTEQWEDEFCITSHYPNITLNSPNLVALHGCLCFTVMSLTGNKMGICQTCILWIMRKYGIHESWSCKHIFIPQTLECTPVAFSKDGSKALCGGAMHLYWYDHQRHRKSKLFEVDVTLSDRVPLLCVGSLVSVPGSSQMKVEGN